MQIGDENVHLVRCVLDEVFGSGCAGATFVVKKNGSQKSELIIAEVAKKYGDAWIENAIREANDTSNPGLQRTAFKMETDSLLVATTRSRDTF